MSRIFMAWELGANYGHLSRLEPVATQLRRQGHEVMFAVRDTGVAAAVLASKGIPFVQAPFWHGGACLKSPPVNYAELLLAEGYHIPNGLDGMIGAWLNLFSLSAVDLVVVDHSPTALIAAHLAKLPAVAIDNGFGVPPKSSPLPSIRPWETVSEQRLYHAETTVLQAINLSCKAFGGGGYHRLVDLFAINGVVFSNFPQLDPYGVRCGADYAGPIFTDVGQQAVSWQGGSRKKIFAYLRRDIPGLGGFLKIMGQLDAEVICAVPGLSKLIRVQGGLRIYPYPLHLSGLLAEADLVVSYSGGGMIAASLLSGVPLLLIPQNVEQYLLACRVTELGAGLSLGSERSEENFRISLEKLLAEPNFGVTARQFAKAYAGFHPGQAIDKTVQVIASALG